MEMNIQELNQINIEGRDLTIGAKVVIKELDSEKTYVAQLKEIWNEEEFVFYKIEEDLNQYLHLDEFKLLKTYEQENVLYIDKFGMNTISNDLFLGIVGRKEVEHFTKFDYDLSNVVLISVTDPGSNPLDSNVTKNFFESLNIQFWDIEEKIGNYDVLTNEQAIELNKFIMQNKDLKFLINCEAGISRSAGVGLAIECLINYDGSLYDHQTSHSDIKAHPRYSPNRVVYNKIVSTT